MSDQASDQATDDATGRAEKPPVDLKATVFLPKTDFPMRAGLPAKEPEILARWAEMDLYGRLRRGSAGREKFILHDGPPYANGEIHIGTGMNKILKDVVVRSYQMLGRDSVYVPGWDCHGLPIEWKIEERYRAEGRDKDAVSVLDFRAECRAFAEHWLEVQRRDFKRLGVVGDWDRPYTTMTREAEAQIAAEIHKFLMNGGLFRGLRPVMWSPVEKTALADAEVEYHDHTSTTIWVRFPVVRPTAPALDGASIVIWTTTPWTIPGNRALAAGAGIRYGVYRVTEAGEARGAAVGDRLVLAVELAEDVRARAGIAAWELEAELDGTALAGTVCRHPLADADPYYQGLTPTVLIGDFVTTDQGTGIVHIAPGHGEDDFELGRANGVEVPYTVEDDGRFHDSVGLFAGVHVFKADGPVISALAGQGALLAKGRLVHSYPHSWRSKQPLIFRAVPQIFISMETNDLRARALAAIDSTRWVPERGHNRIHAMVSQRPDWNISRQRAWGVPVAIFYNRADPRVLLQDEAVNARICAAFREEGSDAWYAREKAWFLGPDHDPEDWVQVFDIVDVWFESGCTHAFVLEEREDLAWPASLYLEGSDQHRGWFHSSLLESVGTRGRAPYDAVLTHGFVLDEQGRKMSKSLGNVVAPQQVCDQYGADILRLWVVGSDYSEDLRIGPEIIKSHVDIYRRLRNTLRYLLGALDGFDPAERVEPVAMPELERWVLHRTAEMDRIVRTSIADYDFHRMFAALHHFCAVDLSAFYFDIRKDSLYCDRPDHPVRRSVRTVLDRLFGCLTTWLAPVLCFTAEEAWQTRTGNGQGSVHEQVFPEIPEAWIDRRLAERWERVRDLRRAVLGALEVARTDKVIGAALQAHPRVFVEDSLAEAVAGVDLAEICITSGLTLELGRGPESAFRLADGPPVAVLVERATGEKCERCWKVLDEAVPRPASGTTLCNRCDDAVEAWRGAGAAA